MYIIINPIKIVNLMANIKKILGIIFLVVGIPIVLYSGMGVFFSIARGVLLLRLAELRPWYVSVVIIFVLGIGILVSGIVLLIQERKK